MAEEVASSDARTLCKGKYSAWLKKSKSEGGRGKWIASTNKRYFTIDFEAKIVFYAHSSDQKKVSQPIKFKEIVWAERLPPCKKKKGCGFILNTVDRRYELYTDSNPDAVQWVHALNAAGEIGKNRSQAENIGNTTEVSNQRPAEYRSEIDSQYEGSYREADFADLDAAHSTVAGSPPPEEEEEPKAVSAVQQPQRAQRPKVLPSLATTAPTAAVQANVNTVATPALMEVSSQKEECQKLLDQNPESQVRSEMEKLQQASEDADNMHADYLAGESTAVGTDVRPQESQQGVKVGLPTTMQEDTAEQEERSANLAPRIDSLKECNGAEDAVPTAKADARGAEEGEVHPSVAQPAAKDSTQPQPAKSVKSLPPLTSAFRRGAASVRSPRLALSPTPEGKQAQAAETSDEMRSVHHKSESDDPFSIEDEPGAAAPDFAAVNTSDSLDVSMDSQGIGAFYDVQGIGIPPSQSHRGCMEPANCPKSQSSTKADSKIGLSQSAQAGEKSQEEDAIRGHHQSLQSGRVQDDISKQQPAAENEPSSISEELSQPANSMDALSGEAGSQKLETPKRRSRVSFKETPEEYQVVQHENEHLGDDPEVLLAGGAEGALPSDMSSLLVHCGMGADGEDASDYDSDEEQPVILSDRATEPSGWDSEDENEIEKSTGQEDAQNACGAPKITTGAFVESRPHIAAT
jgi:hypothetical protein